MINKMKGIYQFLAAAWQSILLKKNSPVIFQWLFWLACFISLSSFQGKNATYNIEDYGAKGDGKTINTTAINKAIQTCYDEGGGMVIIPHGNFISGTVVILSDVNLHLEAGAVLSGSTDTSDYLPIKRALFSEGYNRYGLIYAEDAKNISLTGQGELQGNGTYFMNGIDKPHMGHDFDRKFVRQGQEFMKPGTIFEDGPVSYAFRPGLMMTIAHCENVQIHEVTFKDSPEWTIRIGDCDGVHVSGITITNNPLIPNNDGIHCTSSRNITISDCTITTGDDAIIVSGFGNDPLPGEATNSSYKYGNKTGYAENVAVSNCILSSRSACIRIGYGEHPIRNVVLNNLVLFASNRGIGIFARNKSSIEHIIFSNITIQTRLHSGHWWGKGEPIHISAIKDAENATVGKIKDILFSNITIISETGIVIQGNHESSIEDITLDRVRLQINKGKYTESYGGNFDLRPAYPVDSALFKHDIPGLYAQYINNLTVSNFNLNWGTGLPAFFTNGIEVDHFQNVQLENCFVKPATAAKTLSGIKLSNGTGADVFRCHTEDGAQLIQKLHVL